MAPNARIHNVASHTHHLWPPLRVVLSTDACEKGKDCIKSHVSPAINSPGTFIPAYGLQHLAYIITATEIQKPLVTHPVHAPPTSSHSSTPRRFGPACTCPACPFSHPWHQPCQFGARCIRVNTHTGILKDGNYLQLLWALDTDITVNVSAPGVSSPHRSVTLNKGTDNVKEKLEKQIKGLEAQKKGVLRQRQPQARASPQTRRL